MCYFPLKLSDLGLLCAHHKTQVSRDQDCAQSSLLNLQDQEPLAVIGFELKVSPTVSDLNDPTLGTILKVIRALTRWGSAMRSESIVDLCQLQRVLALARILSAIKYLAMEQASTTTIRATPAHRPSP